MLRLLRLLPVPPLRPQNRRQPPLRPRVAVVTADTGEQLAQIVEFPLSPIPAANVSTVPLLSPLRYPGGKTWLIPHIREWLSQQPQKPRLLIEPFSGGSIVSLTAVAEQLTDRCLMVELDRDVAAFWHAALRHPEQLQAMIASFEPSHDSIRQLVEDTPDSVVEHGFRTLVLNRTTRGGILAAGASLLRHGEDGRGVTSRWYPQTLQKRIANIGQNNERVVFVEGDGLTVLQAVADNPRTVVFADPPYTAGKRRRLYNHHSVDPRTVFETLAAADYDFLLTYDPAPDIVALIDEYSFSACHVTAATTHHSRKAELIITRRPVFTEGERL